MREQRTSTFFVDSIIDPLRILFVPVVIKFQRTADNVKFGVDVDPHLWTKLVTLNKRLFGAGQCFPEHRRFQMRSEDESCFVQRRTKRDQSPGSGYDPQGR